MFLRVGFNLSLVGACIAGPLMVQGVDFGVAGAVGAGVFGVGCGEKRKGQRSERRAEPSPAPTIELRNSAKI